MCQTSVVYHLRAQGLSKGDEHPTYNRHRVWSALPFTCRGVSLAWLYQNCEACMPCHDGLAVCCNSLLQAHSAVRVDRRYWLESTHTTTEQSTTQCRATAAALCGSRQRSNIHLPRNFIEVATGHSLPANILTRFIKFYLFLFMRELLEFSRWIIFSCCAYVLCHILITKRKLPFHWPFLVHVV